MPVTLERSLRPFIQLVEGPVLFRTFPRHRLGEMNRGCRGYSSGFWRMMTFVPTGTRS
jgi:hypothetical protein